MTDAQLSTLTAQVLWAVFILGAVLAVLAQRTRFCTMGAVADIVGMGDWSRMRMWALAVGVAVLGFQGMVAAGWVQASASVHGAPRWAWASATVGGLMFGFGMVLASGCGNKTLLRAATGNLKSLVVLLVMGLTGWMTMRGLTAVWRVATVDQWALALPVSQDLPSLLAHATGWAKGQAALLTGGLIGGACIVWALVREEGRRAEVLVGGIGMGLLITAVWWVTGRLGFVAEHPATLEPAFAGSGTGRMESVTFVSPAVALLEWLVFYSDASRVVTVGLALLLGVASGAFGDALLTRRFRWESFRDAADMRRHLAGGALMGVGGVTALGCTFGQGLSGVSTLGLTSWTALAALIAGAVLGLRWQERQVECDA
jgi:uncharacterized membrane protein YedE/YeeE